MINHISSSKSVFRIDALDCDLWIWFWVGRRHLSFTHTNRIKPHPQISGKQLLSSLLLSFEERCFHRFFMIYSQRKVQCHSRWKRCVAAALKHCSRKDEGRIDIKWWKPCVCILQQHACASLQYHVSRRSFSFENHRFRRHVKLWICSFLFAYISSTYLILKGFSWQGKFYQNQKGGNVKNISNIYC